MNYTRITSRLMNDNIIRNLMTNRSQLNQTQEQIASGKRVTTPSDDPTATIGILNSKTSLSKIENYLNNTNMADSELEITDKAILSTVEIVHRVKELTVKAANVTTGKDELTAINGELEQLIQQVKDTANTKFGNKYVFGGVKTEVEPFSNYSNGIKYNGTPETGDYKRLMEIGDNITIPMNISGDQLFGECYQDINADNSLKYDAAGNPVMVGNGLLNTLTTLSNELKATSPNPDNIRSKLANLDTDLTNLLDKQAEVGGIISRLGMTKIKLEDDSLTITKFKSSVEDIDLAQSITELNFQQTALQASLQVSAKVIQPSLLNFI